jgi:hypothetical protein
MCPHCRNYQVRRRKRAGIKLYLASLFGRWPYHCESCGTRFFLRKRYPKRKKSEQGGERDDGPLQRVD